MEAVMGCMRLWGSGRLFDCLWAAHVATRSCTDAISRAGAFVHAGNVAVVTGGDSSGNVTEV